MSELLGSGQTFGSPLAVCKTADLPSRPGAPPQATRWGPARRARSGLVGVACRLSRSPATASLAIRVSSTRG